MNMKVLQQKKKTPKKIGTYIFNTKNLPLIPLPFSILYNENENSDAKKK